MPSKRKPTIRELDEKMNIMVSRVDTFLNMIVQEIEKHNTIISKMLEAQGLMDSQECGSCGGIVRTPILDGIDKVDECPYCNEPLNKEQQKLPLEEE